MREAIGGGSDFATQLLGGQNRISRYSMCGHCGEVIADGPVALYASDQYIGVCRLVDKRLILEF